MHTKYSNPQKPSKEQTNSAVMYLMAIVRINESGLFRVDDHLSAYAPSLSFSLVRPASALVVPPQFPRFTIAAPANTFATL